MGLWELATSVGLFFSIKAAVLWHCTLKTAVRGEKAVIFPLRDNLCARASLCYMCASVLRECKL